jgi:hypothetical protein
MKLPVNNRLLLVGGVIAVIGILRSLFPGGTTIEIGPHFDPLESIPGYIIILAGLVIIALGLALEIAVNRKKSNSDQFSIAGRMTTNRAPFV